MMIPEIKARWLEALRSGKYAQGNGFLRLGGDEEGAPEEFCCLGVLCDLVDPTAWDTRDSVRTFNFEDSEVMADRMPPLGVYNVTGLDMDAATVLAHKNDAGYSFEEIAHMIEFDDFEDDDISV